MSKPQYEVCEVTERGDGATRYWPVTRPGYHGIVVGPDTTPLDVLKELREFRRSQWYGHASAAANSDINAARQKATARERAKDVDLVDEALDAMIYMGVCDE
jgi:hypothetical protein